jgi:hypothetical protein
MSKKNMFPLPPHVWFEIGSLLVGLACWYKLKRSVFIWFVPFLWFIVSVELTGRYLRKELHADNVGLYNISVPIEFLFYAFIFWSTFAIRIFRRLTGSFIILFFLFVIVNTLFIQGFKNFTTNVLKVGNFFMIIVCCLYFTELMRQEKQVQLLKEPMFWIATGVFLFNAGEIFYTLFADYLIGMGLDNAGKIFGSINNKLIWFLYTCLAIAFLCTKPKQQKT